MLVKNQHSSLIRIQALPIANKSEETVIEAIVTEAAW